MSEAMDEMDESADGDSGKKKGKKKGKNSSGGMLASGLIKILVVVALIILALLFIVTVTVVTFNILDRGSTTSILTSINNERYNPPGNHEYMEPAMMIRGRTSDRVGRTFMVEVMLGYQPGDERTASELGRRSHQLQDLLRQFFSSQRVENLAPEREDALKAELRNQVNSILSQGRVTDVIFTQFIVDFS
jgi:flagellar protein FliL